MRRFILDTDGGVDDAQALLMLLANGRRPDLITTVFGNVGLEAATRNVLTTLAVAGADIEVRTGAARPLVQPVIDARAIHGDDGLGGAPRPASTSRPAGADAILALCRVFNAAAEAGEKADILMIGPLTNLALALRLDPAIAAGIGRLTIMGGTIHGRGNTTPAAEFNIYADPEAAEIVLTAGLDTLVVPWEPCVTHFLDGPEVDRLFAAVGDSEAKRFSLALAAHARRTIASYGGGDRLRFVDPLAAAVVIDPGIVTGSVVASVSVALAPGLARGLTIIDPSLRLGTPKVEVLETAKLDRVTEMYAASIGHGPGSP